MGKPQTRGEGKHDCNYLDVSGLPCETQLELASDDGDREDDILTVVSDCQAHDARRRLHDLGHRAGAKVMYHTLILDVDPCEERADELALLIQLN